MRRAAGATSFPVRGNTRRVCARRLSWLRGRERERERRRSAKQERKRERERDADHRGRWLATVTQIPTASQHEPGTMALQVGDQSLLTLTRMGWTIHFTTSTPDQFLATPPAAEGHQESATPTTGGTPPPNHRPQPQQPPTEKQHSNPRGKGQPRHSSTTARQCTTTSSSGGRPHQQPTVGR